MWRRIANIALVVVIWSAIAAYVTFSALLVRRHNQEQNVERLAIEIVDSTASGQLITSQRVREMLLDRGIATINTNIRSVDTQAIREMICKEGFVDYVGIYASYSGTLHIRISQRKPLLRFMVDGYNCYITADGYVFRSPERAALYIPVVSGDYSPIFESGYEGRLSDVIEASRVECLDSVRIVGRQRAPILERQEFWLSRRKAVRDSTIEDRAERKRLNRYIDGHLRDCKRALEGVEAQQRAVEARFERKVERYDELNSLLDFVAKTQSDSFWRAEIVQIVATTTSDNRLSLILIPRSGNHRIEFGWLENCEQKLDKLRTFYDKVAVTRGWDSYKMVNLNYADKIICTYKDEN